MPFMIEYIFGAFVGMDYRPTLQSHTQVQVHWAAANLNGRYIDSVVLIYHACTVPR